MEIEKEYFTLSEVLNRWPITEADLIYLAENDKLRLSVRVFHVMLEFSADRETEDGERFRIPYERGWFSGLLDLHAHDVFQLFRYGEIHIRDFRTPHAPFATVYGQADPIFVMIGDLLLRREERDTFETEAGFSAATSATMQPAFKVFRGYHEVHCGGHQFRLGPIQAQVVRALHKAARNGQPWQDGKAVLLAAGSKSLKMSDVFKSQKQWRSLIKSNRRGDYRLNDSCF